MNNLSPWYWPSINFIGAEKSSEREPECVSEKILHSDVWHTSKDPHLHYFLSSDNEVQLYYFSPH